MKQKLRVFLTLLLCAVASVGWAETYKLTISSSDFNTTSYAANNNEKTSTAVSTVDPTKTFEVKWTSNQVMKSSDHMQWQKNNGSIYNSTDLGTITSVSVVQTTGTDVSFTTYYGTSQKPSTSTEVGGGFFQVKVGSKTGSTQSIEVTFEISGGETPIDPRTEVALSFPSATYEANVNESFESPVATATPAVTGITYSSSNTNVATVDENSGAVTLVDKGTTIITASFAGDDEYKPATASYTLNVTRTAVVEDGFFNFEDKSLDYGSGVTTTSSDEYITEEKTWTAGNVTLVTSGKYRWWDNDGTLRFYSNNPASAMTFSVPEGKVIKSIVITGGQNFTANVGTYTSGTWTGQAQTVTLSYAATSGSANVKTVTVTYEDGTPAVEKIDIATLNGISPTTLTVGDLDEFTLDATFVEGVTASDYTITWESSNTDVLELADATYEAKAAGTANVTVTITPTDTEAYNMVSRTFAVTVEEEEPEGNWVLTDLADLTSTDVFVIVGNNGSNYALANDKGTSSAPTAVNVTVEDDYLTSEVANNIKWNVSGTTEGYTFYPNGTTETWLYCTNNNNGLRVGTGDDKTFAITDDYLFNTGQERYIGIYNSADWRSYTSVNNNIKDQTFAFYKFVAGAPTPSITAEDVEIAYNATSGSISYTVNNPVDGGELTATDNADWLELGTVGETVPFTATENTLATARTAEVVLTYTYGENSVSKTVTITQTGNPNVVDEISDITETGKDYAIRGTIVAKSARGLVFGDGTGYVYYYLGSAPDDYNVGDIKKISGTMGSYNHVFQFTSSATIEGAESSNYQNTPAVTVVDATSMAAYSDGLHLSDYVQFEGTLVKSGNYYNIKVNGLGTDASISYPTDEQKTALDNLENKNVVVKGYFSGVSGGHFSIVLVSIEEATKTVEVTISDAGYSTLYYGTKNLTVPEDMEAYTVKVTTKVERSTTYNAGDVIPAGTGVVLKADKGDYVFTVVDEAPAKDEANMLRGSDEKATTTGGTYFYALTLDKNGQNPGFYWMVENGGAYDAGAHKAYLALDKTFAELAGSGSAKGFLALPGDETDGIHQIENGQLTFDNAEIYNLSGQRVQKAAKGIYIVNGKKVVVK